MSRFIPRLVQSQPKIHALVTWLLLGLAMALFAAPASAQQSGDITGSVMQADGAGVAGVSVEASSNVLPQARSATTASNGRYLLRLLPPGDYDVKFTFSDGSSETRSTVVRLQQRSTVNVMLGATMDEIVVTASQGLLDPGQGALKNSINARTIDALPVGQEYRDLMKLIPGVQYTENAVRGPSAGGSGQDNTYLFDGVDVSLPLFGVLASEPSIHDIAQVSIVRGGAKAVGFNRSGGFLMNTISKRGSDEFHGEVSYQFQNDGMAGSRDSGAALLAFEEDRSWTTFSLGGPILRDRLYFYTSYYRPDFSRSNVANVYGPVGGFENIRDEYFVKLTLAPTDNILLDASYRTSDREVANASIGAFSAATASQGSEATQDILILEGAWILSDTTSLNFKYTDFENKNSSRPDTQFNFATVAGDSLNVGALDQQGSFSVPQPITGETDYNAFIQPLIDQYGYSDGGVQTGGGAVGGYFRFNEQDFFRESFEISLDHVIYAGDTTHDLHFGYQFMDIAEDVARTSNGWGRISVPGGRTLTDSGVPIFYEARIYQQSLVDTSGVALVPSIFSSSELQSIEFNDTITKGDWTYNIGVMISNDTLFGQGLAPDASNPLTGLTPSPGTPYKMYEVDWKDMIQPRLGAKWEYSDTASLYFNYARYNPSASSLARAASYDRNLRREIRVRWDANGDFIEIDPVSASSGKWFQENMTPRRTDEVLIGTVQEMSGDWTLRAHVRHRRSSHFWEDTFNSGRLFWEPPAGIPRELYIENLQDIRDEIGGSSFVIADLDGALTKYWEASVEAEWTRDNWFLRGSYVWSHYYGNFDQDLTTTFNDQAIFIGSSNIADAAGRNLWDFKYGNLSGDRRHMLKVYGYYEFESWNSSVGAVLIAQSGEPWETWDSNFYRALTGSTSDTIRFSEPAGSRTTSAHWQLDVNYTHNFAFGDYNLQLRADVFNLFDKQTGYAIQRKINNSGYGQPTNSFRPRLLQVAVKLAF
ncbi:MAG: carboxypeptidase regulatory-like domain-containing protein [Proteobacteria bacterium]|nr:carboxypeptidase regulatory-like domain-containing protein [Pseudomonadota bacterium]